MARNVREIHVSCTLCRMAFSIFPDYISGRFIAVQALTISPNCLQSLRAYICHVMMANLCKGAFRVVVAKMRSPKLRESSVLVPFRPDNPPIRHCFDLLTFRLPTRMRTITECSFIAYDQDSSASMHN